ncbi:MAG: NAD(P)/FAD-dependent oxidoreductase, partial [Spirochaetota bacterium]
VGVALLEKEEDVSFGVSKGNSGVVHAGFHHSPSTLKAALEVKGSMMFDALQGELHFPFKRCGVVVAGFSVEEMGSVEGLYQQGVQNGSVGVELCSRERILELVGSLNPDVVGGLYAPAGGIVEPYRFVFSVVESAVKNGVDVITGFEVAAKEYNQGVYTVISSDERKLRARYVINAAGLHADRISGVFGAERYKITPRKGEYFIIDRNASYIPSRVVFPAPAEHTKGILVIPTVEGTALIGPTAQEVDDKEDAATSSENFEKIFYFARRLVPEISEKDIINSFSGLRPVVRDEDFIIEISQKAPNFINVGGIQSPGLTASPAIAEFVKNLLKKAGCRLAERPDYDPLIQEPERVRNAWPSYVDNLIKKDRRYGRVVCRCENVSEAEVVEAIKKGHHTLDGIKFYTRAQMGRCQGGFCTYKIIKIIQRETGLSFTEITKRGKNSQVLKAPIKIGG